MTVEGPPGFGCRIHLRSDEPFEKIVERAKFCEKHDYDIVLVDDHLLYGTPAAAAPETFSTVTAIGMRTRKVRVAVAVTDPVRRHPAILAQTSMTVSNILQGRFILGLGGGDPMNLQPFGIPTKNRFAKFREGVRVMKTLWASSIDKPSSFKGRFYDLDHAYLQPGTANPLAPPPLYFAAFGEKMLRFTGEEADGWIPHCHTPKTFRRDLDMVSESARRVGRPVENIVPAYYTIASLDYKREEAYTQVLGPAKFFLALMPEALWKIDPGAEHPGRVWEKTTDPRMQREKIREIALRIPDKIALETVIHGTPEDCIEQISSYKKQGCREFMLTFAPETGLWAGGDDVMEMAGLFSEKVVSYFKDEYDQTR